MATRCAHTRLDKLCCRVHTHSAGAVQPGLPAGRSVGCGRRELLVDGAIAASATDASGGASMGTGGVSRGASRANLDFGGAAGGAGWEDEVAEPVDEAVVY